MVYVVVILVLVVKMIKEFEVVGIMDYWFFGFMIEDVFL